MLIGFGHGTRVGKWQRRNSTKSGSIPSLLQTSCVQTGHPLQKAGAKDSPLPPSNLMGTGIRGRSGSILGTGVGVGRENRMEGKVGHGRRLGSSS